MDKVIDVCGYLFIVCTICAFIVFIIEIIVSSFKMDNYIKYTDKKCVIESNDIISLHKGSNGDIFLLKNKTHYFVYAKTDNGYFFDRQSISNCYIKMIHSEEAPRIDAIREYTECEVVKKVPIVLRLNCASLLNYYKTGDKYNIDNGMYYVIYIPQNSHIEYYEEID